MSEQAPLPQSDTEFHFLSIDGEPQDPVTQQPRDPAADEKLERLVESYQERYADPLSSLERVSDELQKVNQKISDGERTIENFKQVNFLSRLQVIMMQSQDE